MSTCLCWVWVCTLRVCLYCNISTIILTTFVGFSGELEDGTPYKDNQVYHNLGGKMVTLSHKYTICIINLHKILKSTTQKLPCLRKSQSPSEALA